MTRATRGHGSVIQIAPGKWMVKVPVGKHSSGRTRYVTETHPTKSRANRARLRLLAKRENQTLVAGPKVTLRQYATEVLQASNDHVSQRTLDGYLRNLTKHVFPTIGSKAISDVSPLELQRLLTRLRQEYSASTVNNVRIGLSKVFSEAMHHRLVDSNPVAGTQKAKRQEWEATQVRPPWTVDEVLRAREAIDSTSLRAPLTLLLSTGMRLGEMLGLRWSDVDFENESLSIERSLSHQSVRQRDGSKKYGAVVRPPKTASGRRIIKLRGPMLDILALHKAEQDLAVVAAGKSWDDSGYVFTNIVGGPMDESKFRKKFKELMRNGGVREIRLHDIRHTFATILLENDSSTLAAVSRALGHASVAITFDTYARTARVEDLATSQMSHILFPEMTDSQLNSSQRLADVRAVMNRRGITDSHGH